jgi:ribosomal protein S18 acetylase RimI-like enzyme
LEARLGGAAAGHLAAAPNGTIWQLAVRPDCRREGGGPALLRALARRTGAALRYVNVQADDAGTLGLLASCGIGPGVGQYEMILELPSP